MTPQERVARVIARRWNMSAKNKDVREDADDILAAFTSDEAVAEWAVVLNAHVARPASSPFCACGWRPLMSFNDTESDRGQHRTHQAEALRDHLRGAS